jgi:carbohydrate-binding DOMON domain-containing protein
MVKVWWKAAAAAAALWVAAAAATPAATAQKVSFKDPTDDDDGPGKVTYPTDPVYKRGSFDMTGFGLKVRGDRVDVEVEMAAKLEDPWKTGSGFSLQMVFVFIQIHPRKPAAGKAPEVGKAPGAGFTEGPPGLGIQFAPDDAWDRCIILSPEPAARVKAEVEAKAAAMKDAIVVPARVRGSGRTISATVDRKALGPGNPAGWGYQVAIASSDPYPAAGSLLVRKVNETASQHRFGGGTDGDCAPNVLDVLAGSGKGEPQEVEEQHAMLQYECNADNSSKKLATLKLVHLQTKKEED